ncbi:mannosylglycoprotein endo-beta-mannosidase [Tanacetum coccineum]
MTQKKQFKSSKNFLTMAIKVKGEKKETMKTESGNCLLQKFYNRFSSEGNDVKVSEINGTEDGVAFFLNFSVHASNKDHKKGEDTRILPVHYSDNYFSLVPGEEMAVTISFEVPMSVTPRVSLHGWNYDSAHTAH